MDIKPILFFADRLPPLIGGMEMHAQYFIEYFQKHNHFPLCGVISKTLDGEDILLSNGHQSLFDIKKLSKECQPTILFFNSGRWIEELIELRELFPSALFIYRTGGNEILKAPLANRTISNHSLRQAYWASVLNECVDLMLTNSLFTEKRLRAIGISCLFERCVGGVNTQAIKAKKFVMRDNLIRIFCAARFVPYKNHSLLISVVNELILRGYNINLRLAGDGPLLTSIQEKVKKSELENAVRFLGALSNKEVCEEMSKADIYMQFSTDFLTHVPGGEYIHSEGMGRSILEAISAGLFVIAVKSGALSEIVNENKGLLIELNNPSEMADQIEIALKNLPYKLDVIDNYSWKNLFTRYEKFMNQRCYK